MVTEATRIEKRAMVFASNVATLQEAVARINKQAAKLGVEPVELTFTGKEDFLKRGDAEASSHAVYRRVEVVVVGVMPKLAGWELVGKIEWEGDAPLLLTVPDQTIPESHRNLGRACQHCALQRERASVLILRHESGEHKQVGRTCLKDFLGAYGLDPERALDIATTIAEFIDALGDENDVTGGGSYGTIYLSTLEVVQTTIAVLKDSEWVSRSRAQGTGEPATAAIVGELLTPVDPVPPKLRERRGEIKQRIEFGTVKEEAAAAIAWAKTHAGSTNEYLFNLAALVAQEQVSVKRLGLVASLYSAHRRAIGQELERARKATSNWIGTEGKREVFKLTFKGVRVFERDFISYRCEFEDVAGNVVLWWASNDPEKDAGLKLGETYSIKASVKKHDEFKGVKQTVVTRAVVVKESK